MNELTTQSTVLPASVGIFGDLTKFQEMTQIAGFLSESDLVPESFQRKPANTMIALNIAQRLGADPFMIMQSLHVIHGRPSFSSQFLIAMVNSSGRFSAINYEKQEGPDVQAKYVYFSGQGPSKQRLEKTFNVQNNRCRAYATELSTGDVVHGPWVSMEMAVNEGWYSKNGSKWQTMPELMLEYRAAAFFVRTRCPDMALGMYTAEEAKDMGQAEIVNDGTSKASEVFSKMAQQKAEHAAPADGEVIEEKTAKGGAKVDDSGVNMVTYLKGKIDQCATVEEFAALRDQIGEEMSQSTMAEYKEVKDYFLLKFEPVKKAAEEAEALEKAQAEEKALQEEKAKQAAAKKEPTKVKATASAKPKAEQSNQTDSGTNKAE